MRFTIRDLFWLLFSISLLLVGMGAGHAFHASTISTMRYNNEILESRAIFYEQLWKEEKNRD